MRRISILLPALALGCGIAAGASSADRPPITQAASGETVRVAKGKHAVLRLSNHWRWSEPRVSSDEIELTPVSYFVDPGFSEWTIEARKRGRATIHALGRPNCSACALTARHFVLTVVVTPR
jgi:predicted secreted protein